MRRALRASRLAQCGCGAVARLSVSVRSMGSDNRFVQTGDGTVGHFHLTPMGEGDMIQKTIMSPLSKSMESSRDVGILTVAQHGFRLVNSTFLYGPIAVFPKICLSWRVLNAQEITFDSLEFFTLLEPKLDVVVVGVGDRENIDSVRHRIHRQFRDARIGLEILTTFDASATFNFLNADGRYVGAALLPPTKLPMGQYELAQTNMQLHAEMLTEAREDTIFGIEHMKHSGSLENSLLGKGPEFLSHNRVIKRMEAEKAAARTQKHLFPLQDGQNEIQSVKDTSDKEVKKIEEK